MKYKILRSGEMEELQKKVNKYIGKGWAPIGGISVCGGYAHAHFHQAIQKGCDTQDYPTIADINELQISINNVAEAINQISPGTLEIPAMEEA